MVYGYSHESKAFYILGERMDVVAKKIKTLPKGKEKRRNRKTHVKKTGVRNFIPIPVNYLMFDKYGKGEAATFGQLSYSQVYHGQ